MSTVGLRMGVEGPRRRARRDRRRNRRAAWVTFWMVIVLLVAGVFLGGKAITFLRGGPSPDYPGPGLDPVVFELKPGSISSIGRELTLQGVTASAGAFVDAAKKDTRASGIQPGWYRLNRQMSAREALVGLLDKGSRAENKVTLPEGLRLTETIARLAQGTKLSAASLTAALDDPSIGLPEYAKGQAEGFLFPSTYEIPPNATPAEVLRFTTTQFTTVADKVGLDSGRPGVTPYQLVTIASLIEAEAKHPEDYRKVSRVIYNRLDLKMKLQFDSTVNYALKAKKAVVLNKDLEVDSPYNTYQRTGLPPGAINSPGEQALRAALAPAEGNWIYFVTTNLKTGETKFTDSLAEFLRFKAELKRNR